MGETFWLVGYSQKEKGHQYPVANKAINDHPVDWLMEMNERYPDCTNVVHFAIEINREQYEKAKYNI